MTHGNCNTPGELRAGTNATSGLLLLTIAYIGFISLGLPDPVAGVAWPSVRAAFALPQSAFGLVFIALGCGYCLSGFFGGTLTQALGLGNLLWVSSGLVALAMLGSGLAPGWLPFVACAVLWGLGSGGIDAGLNAHVSQHYSARHVNWLHACYSLGATLGPLLMTAVLVTSGNWRVGYWLVGGLLAAMTAVFLMTRRRWEQPATDQPMSQPPKLWQALTRPLVWLHVGMFFLYVGLEFTVGQWSFTLLTEARAFSTDQAGALAAGYYAAIGVGRVLSGAIAPRLGPSTLLRAALLIVLAGAALFALANSNVFAAAGLLLIGLGLAPVFPTLMAATPTRVGANISPHAIGFQVSAGMLGAAVVPGVAGLLVQPFGLASVNLFALVLAGLLFSTHEVTVLTLKANQH